MAGKIQMYVVKDPQDVSYLVEKTGEILREYNRHGPRVSISVLIEDEKTANAYREAVQKSKQLLLTELARPAKQSFLIKLLETPSKTRGRR